MRAAGVIGILLIVFGAIVLVLRGVSYVKDKDTTDLGIAKVTTESRGFIPPWIGGAAVDAGVGFFSCDPRPLLPPHSLDEHTGDDLPRGAPRSVTQPAPE